MADQTRPEYISVGGIIIDDIVFPNGETRMAVLGGGVTHAAAGIHLWDRQPGIVACAGHDLPESARQRLARDFDLQGVVWLDLPQARAWQVFEWDGRRTEIPRVDEFEPFLYQPPPDQVPAAYRRAKGVHVLREAESLPGWRTVFPDAVLLWEPPQEHMIPEMADDFRAAISQVDIVSPNWLEAQHVYGFGDPAKLIRAMLDDGAGIVALRMGEQGSIVGQRGETSCLTVPPIPVPEIVDQTGAGNTYCGGFLVGWVETGDLLKAACYGVVAASFSLEVIGVADPPANLADLRYGRYAWLAEQVAVSGC